MLAAVRDLGVPYQHERSFRVAPGRLQANRFLLSLDPADLGHDALARVTGVAAQLGLPAAAQAAAREHFDGTLCVHFGFEAGDGAVRCKLYLERCVPAAESQAAAACGEPVLLHRAYKWDPACTDVVESQYHWFPGLDAEAIAARLRALYAGTGAGESLAIALDTLALAAPRFAGGAPQYLEVSEPGNGRRSFDLNLYDAELMVGDLLPAQIRMRERHGIRPGQFQALVDQVRSRALGHLAGGVHREGEDFFNVYYGVAGFPRFASRVR
jgi:tryptophan halogenase